MNLNVQKHPVKEEHYVVSHWCPSKNLLLHFYALEVSVDDIKAIEEEAVKARDYGIETLGTVRLPLYTMGDGYRGFPAFLANSFVSVSREQLLYTLEYKSIMSIEEISKALRARPLQLPVEEEEDSGRVQM
ncbi:U8 snoRNA-decapping enzyme [Zootermopsis nevadensis]|uniref:U8 snoRNA-decapping enzyme n=2 Tax=Zootermopsis nevadensis TaxID=136037 RepID=A0A067RMY4_ZOONE|nr:U8 snoRNA-decapping enzyme [Zootermopsis nevadensis]